MSSSAASSTPTTPPPRVSTNLADVRWLPLEETWSPEEHLCAPDPSGLFRPPYFWQAWEGQGYAAAAPSSSQPQGWEAVCAAAERLHARGLEEVARLLSSDAQEIPAFMTWLFATKTIQQTVSTCIWILCAGCGTPAEVKDEIQRKTAGKSNVCGKIWKNGDIAYKCEDCGYDEPCAICVECFQAGDHTNHDYHMIRVGGGCCDCGDPLAWRPEGNCRFHKGATEDDDPTAMLPPKMREVSKIALTRFVQELVYRLLRLGYVNDTSKMNAVYHAQGRRGTENDAERMPASERERQRKQLTKERDALRNEALFMLQWLMKIVEWFGDGMRRILCDVMNQCLPSGYGMRLERPGTEQALAELKSAAAAAASAAYTASCTKKIKATEKMMVAEKEKEEEEEEKEKELETPEELEDVDDNSVILWLLLVDHIFPSVIIEELRKFYFMLIGDTLFKRRFARAFVKVYCNFIDVVIDNEYEKKQLTELLHEELRAQHERSEQQQPDDGISKEEIEERGFEVAELERQREEIAQYQTPLTMSTQFLHPQLIPLLVQEPSLLTSLLSKLTSTLRSVFVMKPKESEEDGDSEPDLDEYMERVMNDSSIILRKRKYWYLCHDLRATCSVPSVTQHLLFSSGLDEQYACDSSSSNSEEENNYSLFLELWYLLQGMNYYQRRPSSLGHIEYENETWRDAFSLELELLQPIVSFLSEAMLELYLSVELSPDNREDNRLIRAFLSNKGRASSMDDEQWKVPVLKNAIQEAIFSLLTFIHEEFKRVKHNRLKEERLAQKQLAKSSSSFQFAFRKRNKFDGRQVIINFDVMREPVTFHLPLNRLLARLFADASNQFGLSMIDLFPKMMAHVVPSDEGPIPDALANLRHKEWLLSQEDMALLLLEHPLRVQVLAAQISAGLWVRNGEQMHQQAFLYLHTIGANHLSELDLAMMQCSAALLHNCATKREDINKIIFPEELQEREDNKHKTNTKDAFVATLLDRFGLTEFFNWWGTEPKSIAELKRRKRRKREMQFGEEAKEKQGEEEEDHSGNGRVGILTGIQEKLMALMDNDASLEEVGDAFEEHIHELAAMEECTLHQKTVLAEYFARLLINLINERTVVGLPLGQNENAQLSSSEGGFPFASYSLEERKKRRKEESRRHVKDLIKHEIVQYLCISPMTHSQLMKGLSPHLVKTVTTYHKLSLISEILEEVAEFSNAEGMRQGTYSLRQEYWRLFNPYFPHFSTRELEKATENYKHHMKKMNSVKGKTSVIDMPRVSLRPVPLPLFVGVREVVHSHVVLRLMFTVFMKALHDRQVINDGQKAEEEEEETEEMEKHQQDEEERFKLSEPILNSFLNLLLLSLQFFELEIQRAAETRNETEKEKEVTAEMEDTDKAETIVKNIYDMEFSSYDDLLANLGQEFTVLRSSTKTKEGGESTRTTKGSILMFLIQLCDLHSPTLAEQQTVLVEILKMMKKLDALSYPFKQRRKSVTDIIEEHSKTLGNATEPGFKTGRKGEESSEKGKQVVRSGGDAGSSAGKDSEQQEDEETKRKRMLKARQAAVLAQFAAKQQAFLKASGDAFKQMEVEEPAIKRSKTATETQTPEETTNQTEATTTAKDKNVLHEEEEEPMCVFCKEGHREDDPLGLLAFVRPSNVLPIVKKKQERALLESLLENESLKKEEKEEVKEDEKKGEETEEKGKDKLEDVEKQMEKELVLEMEEKVKASGDEMILETQPTEEQEETEGQQEELEQGMTEPGGEESGGRVSAESKHEKEKEEGEEGSSSSDTTSTTPSSPTTTQDIWRSEIHRNVERTQGCFSSSCGHYMHANCRHKYCLSLMQQLWEANAFLHPQMSPLSISRGEFKCPLCRTIANTLIPISSSSSPSSFMLSLSEVSASLCSGFLRDSSSAFRNEEEDEEEEDERGWAHLFKSEEASKGRNMKLTTENEHEANTTEQPTNDEFCMSLQDFARRVYAAYHNVTLDKVDVHHRALSTFLWSLVASMIANMEVTGRGKPKDPNGDSASNSPSSSSSSPSPSRLNTSSASSSSPSSIADKIAEIVSHSNNQAHIVAITEAAIAYASIYSPQNGDEGDVNGEATEYDRALKELNQVIERTEQEDATKEDMPFLERDSFSLWSKLIFLRLGRTMEERQRRQSPLKEDTDVKFLRRRLPLLFLHCLIKSFLTQMIVTPSSPTKQKDKEKEEDADEEEDKQLAAVCQILGDSLTPYLPASVSIQTLFAASSSINWRRLKMGVIDHVLPFLRRVVLFFHVCFKCSLPSSSLPVSSSSSPLSNNTSEDELKENEFKALCSILGLDASVSSLVRHLAPNCALRSVVSGWCKELALSFSKRKRNYHPTYRLGDEDDDALHLQIQQQSKNITQLFKVFVLCEVSPSSTLPFDLCRRALPYLYQDMHFFKTVDLPDSNKCKQCGITPDQPAHCLICGRFLCFGSSCCSKNHLGECNQHAQECGAGEGMFLLLNHTIVVLLRHRIEGTFYLSPYLDSHGEEDFGLKRGRPLFLDPSRKEQLRMLFLKHEIGVLANRKATSSESVSMHWERV
ncbi:E3 ubiquitin-protein ligase ubr1 [Balamuthia mandrillaris]